jgi:hypothetical protein
VGGVPSGDDDADDVTPAKCFGPRTIDFRPSLSSSSLSLKTGQFPVGIIVKSSSTHTTISSQLLYYCYPDTYCTPSWSALLFDEHFFLRPEDG